MANLKLIDNLIASLSHRPRRWRALPADFTTGSGSFWIEAAIDRLRAFSDGMSGVESRHTNFNSHIQI